MLSIKLWVRLTTRCLRQFCSLHCHTAPNLVGLLLIGYATNCRLLVYNKQCAHAMVAPSEMLYMSECIIPLSKRARRPRATDVEVHGRPCAGQRCYLNAFGACTGLPSYHRVQPECKTPLKVQTNHQVATLTPTGSWPSDSTARCPSSYHNMIAGPASLPCSHL